MNIASFLVKKKKKKGERRNREVRKEELLGYSASAHRDLEL